MIYSWFPLKEASHRVSMLILSPNTAKFPVVKSWKTRYKCSNRQNRTENRPAASRNALAYRRTCKRAIGGMGDCNKNCAYSVITHINSSVIIQLIRLGWKQNISGLSGQMQLDNPPPPGTPMQPPQPQSCPMQCIWSPSLFASNTLRTCICRSSLL